MHRVHGSVEEAGPVQLTHDGGHSAGAMDVLEVVVALRRWTCPGTNWVKLLAMATIGLSKSSSVIPVARHNARAPAMLRPWVVVLDRNAGTAYLLSRGSLAAGQSVALTPIDS
ncbi:MAG: hypothetical protein M3137_07490 [Actinomycetota bacterium]|nr:hypothetical protein [Actinomycetota bacterium]